MQFGPGRWVGCPATAQNARFPGRGGVGGPRWEGRRCTPGATCVGRWGSCLPCRPQGSGPGRSRTTPLSGNPRQSSGGSGTGRGDPRPPAPGSQQRPSSRPQVPIGQPAPLKPKRAGGSGPFRNTFGELAALVSSRRHAQNLCKPHKRGRPPPAMVTPSWRRQTGRSQTLPAKRSVVHLSCLSHTR